MNRVEYREKILAANDAAAAALRQRFEETLVVDLVSSPGAGKTSLLEATARRMGSEHRLGAVVGDIATELDAGRLRAAGMPAHQIVTGGACHLDARLVAKALDESGLLPLDVLFIENVGNLVCPASYALGEDFKVALLSVTEGDDKPFKYPAIFARAAVTLITKIDLADRVLFDVEKAAGRIATLNPWAQVIPLSATSGEGMQPWFELLEKERAAKRRTMASA